MSEFRTIPPKLTKDEWNALLDHGLEKPLNYIVRKVDGEVQAINGRTGKIDFRGTDASTVIQSALNGLTAGRTWKESVVLKGTFTLSRQIDIYSYTHITVHGKVVAQNNFPSKNGVYRMFTVASGATDVTVNGLKLDGNKANQPLTGDWVVWSLFFAYNTTRLTLIDLQAWNSRGYGILLDTNAELLMVNPVSDSCSGTGMYINYSGDGTVIKPIARNNGFAGGSWAMGIELAMAPPLVLGGRTYQNDFDGLHIRGAAGEGHSYGGRVIGLKTVQSGRDGIRLANSGSFGVKNARIEFCESYINTGYGIYEESIADYNQILNNRIFDNTAGTILKQGANTKVKYNDGYVTENSGTATILAGATSVVVAHGLAGTPRIAKHCPRANLGAVWVSARDATNITLNVATAPTADTITDWEAEL